MECDMANKWEEWIRDATGLLVKVTTEPLQLNVVVLEWDRESDLLHVEVLGQPKGPFSPQLWIARGHISTVKPLPGR